MHSNAQILISEDIEPVDLVYVRPLGDFRQYETRMLGVAGRFQEHIRVTKVRAGDLFRFTRERVFISKTVPTIVLIRDGVVIAQAVGDLPASEIDFVLRGAVLSRLAA